MNSSVQSTLQIAQLLNLLKVVKGRKKLQKLVHILQELGYPFRESFEYSFYGMYSQQLRSELDVLVEEHFISETEISGQNGFKFEAMPPLGSLLCDLEMTDRPEWADLAMRLNQKSPQELEAISTILVFQRRGLSGVALKEKVLELKPHLASIYDKAVTRAKDLRENARA